MFVQILRLGVRYFCSKNAEPSIWKFFNPDTKPPPPPPRKPPISECKKRRKIARSDPDLSRFGGEPYRTCGPGYVIQKDVIPEAVIVEKDEDRILRKIEADPGRKENVTDPMPPFRTAEQRLIDLCARRLHPVYKKFMEMPKLPEDRDSRDEKGFHPFKCSCEPVRPEQISALFKFDRTVLEKKNIFVDFKMVELPRQEMVMPRFFKAALNKVQEEERKKKAKEEEKAGKKAEKKAEK